MQEVKAYMNESGELRRDLKEVRAFETSDGKLFSDKDAAERHEQILKDVKTYLVKYAPDLTEGKGYQRFGYVLVHARREHELFLKDWLYKQFGNPVCFVQGVYGSNAITESYKYSETMGSELLTKKEILARIEEEFVSKLWGKES